MWVSRVQAKIIARTVLTDLPKELGAVGVELRLVESLQAYMQLRDTSLHVSAIRMRNAGRGPRD